MGFERYVDYALGVPMYFVYRDGRYIDASGQSFRDFMDGRLPALPGERPTISDWGDHLTTAFPEVRLKKFLEMRGADAGSVALAVRPAGLVDRVALRRHRTGRRAELVRDWTAEEHAYLRAEVPRTALAHPVPQRPRARRRARRGGDRQGRAEGAAPGSTGTARTRPAISTGWSRSRPPGRTPAEEKLERFHEAWDGKVDPGVPGVSRSRHHPASCCSLRETVGG